jgi:glutamate/tyrosine decarboxylase-like PLP-dependent enzyme
MKKQYEIYTFTTGTVKKNHSMAKKDIVKRIEALEKESLKLEPGFETRKQWNARVIAYADEFLDSMENRKTFEAYTEEEISGKVFDVPNEPSEIQDVLQQIDRDIDRPGLNPASGGHLAYIPGGGVFPSALGDYLSAVFNKYAGIYYAGPGAVKLENSMIRWMCDLVGFPKTAMGNLTSGGSVATLIAVATARDKKEITPEKIRQSVIYLTEQVHHSADKAIRIAGLGQCIIRKVPIDKNFRMDAEQLNRMVSDDLSQKRNPFMIIASSGTTDTGAIDPIDKIADIAESNSIWLHTDAAYGGFFLLSEELRPRFKGIERSDSITIDPHKGLFLAYGTGAVLMKDVGALAKTHFYTANYMQDKTETPAEPSPADLSPELTKHFRGLRMWLPLKLFGLNTFKAAAEEKYLLTLYFLEKIKTLGFETGPEPDLSIVIYRYNPKNLDANEFNRQLIERVKTDGRVFLSSTTINGKVWLRLVVLSFRTHKKTIDTALEVLEKSVEKLLGES